MTITDQQKYPSLSWDAYRSLPGYSFSGLKNPEGVTPTAKMRLGTLVDKYLFTPKEYSGEHSDIVRPLALALKSMLGDALQHSTPQLAVTCTMHHEGLSMPFRGLIDLPVGRNLIVDLKVSEMPIHKAVAYFRYDWQLSGYSLAYGATNRILLSIHPKTKKISTLPIPLVTDWWEYQIKQHGSLSTLRIN